MSKLNSKARIGNFIEACMVEKGMSVEDLAGSVCLTEAAIRRWLRGETSPSIVTLPLVAKALGVTVGEILNAERQPVESVAESRLGNRIASLGVRTGATMCVLVGFVMASGVLYGLCTAMLLGGVDATQASGFSTWAIVSALWALGGIYLMFEGCKSLNELEK